MVKDYFRLAYQSAKHRKLRAWLTMLGIFIGIAAVVALISLSQGLQNAINDQFIKLGSDKLIVQGAGSGFGPPGTDVVDPLTSDDERVVKKVAGVDIAVGRLIRSAKLEFKDEIKFDFITSMPDKSDNEVRDLVIEANGYEVSHGRLLKKNDQYKVMVGSKYSEDAFDEPVELRDKIKIEKKTFEVIGLLTQSGNPIQDNSIVVPESTFKETMSIGDEYDIIAVKVVSGEDLSIVEARIKKELRQHRNLEEGKEDFSVESPGAILATLNTILSVMQGVLVGIAAISLLVGGIGIMNTMYTAVLERTKEIGIMKAVGARRKTIMLLFLIESGFLGLFGGIIGVLLGMGISKLIEIIAFQVYGSFLIQAHFDPWVIFGALLFAFLVGSFSGVFPARQAAKLKPVDALRK